MAVPDTTSSGTQALRSTAKPIGQAPAAIDQPGSQGSSAAVTYPMADAISRFAATMSETASGIETEMLAANMLAANAAADLQTAGGGERCRDE